MAKPRMKYILPIVALVFITICLMTTGKLCSVVFGGDLNHDNEFKKNIVYDHWDEFKKISDMNFNNSDIIILEYQPLAFEKVTVEDNIIYVNLKVMNDGRIYNTKFSTQNSWLSNFKWRLVDYQLVDNYYTESNVASIIEKNWEEICKAIPKKVGGAELKLVDDKEQVVKNAVLYKDKELYVMTHCKTEKELYTIYIVNPNIHAFELKWLFSHEEKK